VHLETIYSGAAGLVLIGNSISSSNTLKISMTNFFMMSDFDNQTYTLADENISNGIHFMCPGVHMDRITHFMDYYPAAGEPNTANARHQ
jgi:hypothetical protein